MEKIEKLADLIKETNPIIEISNDCETCKHAIAIQEPEGIMQYCKLYQDYIGSQDCADYEEDGA